jgi:tripartite-type tricarboxylate transporter receptor subunit TctC
MNMQNRKLTLTRMISGLGGVLLGLATTTSIAIDYPKQPITLVVGFGAGGGSDVCVRALANEASKELGQSIVVDNKPGAGSSLSISYIVRQRPDGYTLATLSTGGALNPYVTPSVNYDVLQDLTPISMLAQYQVGIAVRADSPWKSITDVIEAAKKQPDGVSVAIAGLGTSLHLAMENLGKTAGVKWMLVPYKSGMEATTALVRGDTELLVQTPEWAPFVREGRLRLLNVFGDDRIVGFDHAPTVKQDGYDMDAPNFLGLVGPQGMDPAIVSKISSAFETAAKTEAFRQCADQFVLKADFRDSQEFKNYIQRTVDSYVPIIKDLNLK